MTVEEARQSIISQADIMCENCGDCEEQCFFRDEWCCDREALEIAAEALESNQKLHNDLKLFAGCYRCKHLKTNGCELHRPEAVYNRTQGCNCERWEYDG